MAFTLNDIVKFSQDKNPVDLKLAFEDIMGAKLRDALDARRNELAGSLCAESVVPEGNK